MPQLSSISPQIHLTQLDLKKAFCCLRKASLKHKFSWGTGGRWDPAGSKAWEWGTEYQDEGCKYYLHSNNKNSLTTFFQLENKWFWKRNTVQVNTLFLHFNKQIFWQTWSVYNRVCVKIYIWKQKSSVSFFQHKPLNFTSGLVQHSFEVN